MFISQREVLSRPLNSTTVSSDDVSQAALRRNTALLFFTVYIFLHFYFLRVAAEGQWHRRTAQHLETKRKFPEEEGGVGEDLLPKANTNVARRWVSCFLWVLCSASKKAIWMLSSSTLLFRSPSRSPRLALGPSAWPARNLWPRSHVKRSPQSRPRRMLPPCWAHTPGTGTHKWSSEAPSLFWMKKETSTEGQVGNEEELKHLA